jgi:hypothetical protein
MSGLFTYRSGSGVAHFAAYKITNPANLIDQLDIVGPRFVYTGIGAGVMSLLIFLRHHFCGGRRTTWVLPSAPPT